LEGEEWQVLGFIEFKIEGEVDSEDVVWKLCVKYKVSVIRSGFRKLVDKVINIVKRR
jgi:hypothetical protein